MFDSSGGLRDSDDPNTESRLIWLSLCCAKAAKCGFSFSFPRRNQDMFLFHVSLREKSSEYL